ncbi:MAG: SPOR domain-containing protein [Chitinophagaceae bacterium]|nr:SPOR domain-containing protein [Chitinophagaceae bacterium]
MKKTAYIFIVLFSLAQLVHAQNADSLKNITVARDARVDALMKKNKEVNEEVYLKSIKNMAGYRLQVINTNDRNKALEIKTKMMSEFPSEKVYFIYQSPYFKVQMGNFRTREDATKLLDKVKKIYPTGVFIVPSRVEIKPSKDGGLIL